MTGTLRGLDFPTGMWSSPDLHSAVRASETRRPAKIPRRGASRFGSVQSDVAAKTARTIASGSGMVPTVFRTGGW